MDNLDRRILLQVAFYNAVDWLKDKEDKTEGHVEEAAQVFYEQLLNLVDKYGIGEGGNRGGQKMSGGGASGGGATEDAPEVTISGTVYKDFRGLKSIGAVDANYPDFKLGTKGFWLKKKDGSPTKFAIDNDLPLPV